jgi:galactokinase
LTDDRTVRLDEDFARLFGRKPDVRSEAYGRVNLIGEHTDYNDGFVLPTSIPQSTIAAFGRRADRRVHVWSGELSPGDTFEQFDLAAESPRRSWIDYVQGVTQALARAGFHVGGFDLALRSTVPLGSGLSSSAALQVVILRGLRDLFGLTLDDVSLAKLGQRAEVDFVGAPVGIMDQMASSLAQPGVALFIDTRSLAYEQVHLPADTELAVINSGVAHNHAAGDYRTRRAECERAAGLLGVPALRDLGLGAMGRVLSLPDPINRRARHVITENQRVLDAVAAMRRGDAKVLGHLFSGLARLAARRLRGVRARSGFAGVAGRSRACRSRRTAHRRRLRRIDRGAGSPRRSLRRRRSRRCGVWKAHRSRSHRARATASTATELAAGRRGGNWPRRHGERGEFKENEVENEGFAGASCYHPCPCLHNCLVANQPELLPAGFANPAEQVALVRKPTGAAREQALSLALERFGAARLTERADDPDGGSRPSGTVPAAEARYAPWPELIDPRLRAALESRGVRQLYTHQAASLEFALSGRNVVVTTPTASGKTLCYNAPVLSTVLADPSTRALYLFPTKALAQDQLAELKS